MMNDSETSDDVSQDVVVHSSIPSLAISPDLNALLEHDERTRGLHQPDDSSPHFWQTPLSGSSSFTFPVGLPPPPRGNRRAASRPTTPKQSESVGFRSKGRSEPSVGASVSFSFVTDITNPFINEPPKLPPLHGPDEPERSNSSASEISSTLEAQDSVPKALHGVIDSTEPDPTRDLRSFRSYPSSVSAARDTSVSPRPADQPIPRTHSLPRVERLIGKGKSMFSISGSQSQDNAQAVPSEDEPESSGLNSVLDRGRQRNFSELSIQSGSTTRQTHKNRDQGQKHRKPPCNKKGGLKAIAPLMTDSSRPSSRSTEEPNRSNRPTLSHWSHSREPSRTRSGSLSSESTRSPATDSRISISSARYSPSYPELPHHTEPSENRNSLSFASPDRDSFIDLFPPSNPKFTTLPERSHTSRLSMSTLKHSSTTFRSFSSDQPPLSPPFPSSSAASSAYPPMHYPKPPIPTTPKPSFKQYSLAQLPTDGKQRRISPGPMHRLAHQASPKTIAESQEPVPPTTNFLNADERADLVKKNRKLTQVFGTTPGAVVVSQKHDGLQLESVVLPSLLPRGPGKSRHARSAVSVSGALKQPTHDAESKSSWPFSDGTLYMTASGRRHSAPFSPDNFSIIHDDTTDGDAHGGQIEIGSQEGAANSDWSSNQAFNRNGPDSPTSFMDLSDGEVSNDGVSNETSQKNSQRLGLPHSLSTPSVVETLTPEEQEEVERKRKRDKLAKLHRFLGSRIPVDLVLGASDRRSLTPPGLRGQANKLDSVSEHEEHRRAWLPRRRSSSAAVYSNRPDDLERLKEDLNDEEKAIHVRRAQKMEKVFGVPPPQTLYTRPLASHSLCSTAAAYSGTIPAAQTGPPSPVGKNRNPNQAPYKGKKKHDRPGTSESTQRLLPSCISGSFDFDPQSPSSLVIPDVYTHYQHSLLSLNDIIDRDDRASLVELHQYLQGEATSPPLQEFTRASSSGSIKSERRHSLPSSIMSVSTADYSVPTPKPESTDFQLRRRRAAKLTQFFGVDYTQIMTDILESIEKGVEEERKRGTLQPEEVEVLLRKVRTLKTKRNGTS